MTETNRFAKQFQDHNTEALSSRSRVRKWYDTSVNEVKVFIEFVIPQGMDSKVENSMYFSKGCFAVIEEDKILIYVLRPIESIPQSEILSNCLTECQ